MALKRDTGDARLKTRLGDFRNDSKEKKIELVSNISCHYSSCFFFFFISISYVAQAGEERQSTREFI